MTDSGTVVELRVHGVSGTPPEAMLGCPVELIERQIGDDQAGFYRRQPWIDETASPAAPNKWRRVMEAYSWGGLTSGRANRALWLLFLPFILVNVAHWMLPPASRKRPAVISVGLLRLIALSFTFTLMLAAAVAVIDVMVWQCAGLGYCSAGWGPLAFLASLDRGCQVAVSALPLVLMIALLWRLGSEEMKVDKGDQPSPPSPAVMEGETPPLAQNTFWSPDDSVLRMRVCHVMVWIAGLAAVTLTAPVRYAESPGARAVSVALLVANAVILAIAVLATASNKATARGGPGASKLMRPLIVLRWIALGLLVASLVWVAFADVNYPAAPTHLPGLHGTIYVLLGVQVVLLVALFVFTGLSMRGTQSARRTKDADGYRMTLGGFTAPFVALIGWLVGSGFSVGVGLWTAQAFGKVVLSTDVASAENEDRSNKLASATTGFEEKTAALGADAPLIVPPPYVWAAVAVVLLIGMAILAGAYVWLRVIPKRTANELNGAMQLPNRGGVLIDYLGVNINELRDAKNGAERLAAIAKARALASLTDIGARIVAGLALMAAAVIVAMAVFYLSVRNFEWLVDWSPMITDVSVAITASLAIGLVALVVQAYRSRQLRRVVAILWDVVTFWPRANHPLTPPSYGARTVWDLRLRLMALTRMADTRVVLVAHSQGTVIAAAILLQANMDRERYPLLTFGSPLRRLYAQNFPAYFGTQALQRLREWQRDPQPRWINLWARTDPIGAWIFDHQNTDLRAAQQEYVDCRLLDVQPKEPGGELRPDPCAPISGHSGFWTRPEYEAAVDALQSTVMPEDSAPPDTSATAPPMADYV